MFSDQSGAFRKSDRPSSHVVLLTRQTRGWAGLSHKSDQTLFPCDNRCTQGKEACAEITLNFYSSW